MVRGRAAGALCQRLGFSVNPGNRMIGDGIERAPAVDCHARARGQGADGAPGRQGFRHAAPQIKTRETGRIRRPGDLPAGEQRLDLGGKAEDAAIVGVIQGLDAVRVARDK